MYRDYLAIDEPSPLTESRKGLFAMMLNSSRRVRDDTSSTLVFSKVRGASNTIAISLALTALME